MCSASQPPVAGHHPRPIRSRPVAFFFWPSSEFLPAVARARSFQNGAFLGKWLMYLVGLQARATSWVAGLSGAPTGCSALTTLAPPPPSACDETYPGPGDPAGS